MSVAVIIESRTDPILSERFSTDILMEYRIDCDPLLLNYLKGSGTLSNAIITLRSKQEYGKHEGLRDNLLQEMIGLRPKYIDLEIDTDLDYLDTITHSIPVVSKHDYSQPMFEAAKEFVHSTTQLHGRDDIVVKFVGDPVDTMDLLKSLNLLKKAFPRHVILGIGQMGLLSRYCAIDFDQEFVFGTQQDDGIIPQYEELLETLDPYALNTGLLGKTLSHSLSPQIHKILRDQDQTPGSYQLFEVHNVEDIDIFLSELLTTSIRGINVTYPYKHLVQQYTYSDELVDRSGVANTLVFEDTEQQIYAYNTDITGFGKFYDTIPNSNKVYSAVILGAGGAARAVAIALLDRNVEVYIVNRTRERLNNLPNELQERCSLHTVNEVDDLPVNLYINATTLGYGSISPTTVFDIPETVELVIDLNYSKTDTILLQDAKNRSILAYDGKAMLFHQAVDAYEIWTGASFDRKSLFRSFQESLL